MNKSLKARNQLVFGLPFCLLGMGFSQPAQASHSFVLPALTDQFCHSCNLIVQDVAPQDSVKSQVSQTPQGLPTESNSLSPTDVKSLVGVDIAVTQKSGLGNTPFDDSSANTGVTFYKPVTQSRDIRVFASPPFETKSVRKGTQSFSGDIHVQDETPLLSQTFESEKSILSTPVQNTIKSADNSLDSHSTNASDNNSPASSTTNPSSVEPAEDPTTSIDGDLPPDGDLPANSAVSESPVTRYQFQQPVSVHLQKGEVVFDLYNRLFFLQGSTQQSGIAAYPNVGFRWGVSNNFEIGVDTQLVDSVFVQKQGDFSFDLNSRNADLFEIAVTAKHRIWQSKNQTQSLSGVVALSVGNRGYSFRQPGLPAVSQSGQVDVVPEVQFPYTFSPNQKLRLTLSPTLAFFQNDHAVYLQRAPINDPGSFGTNFGLTGAASYKLSPRTVLWADAFFPFLGNNSINRQTGRASKQIALNAGLRYLLNPQLGVDLFASNTFGSRGPLSLTADPSRFAIGFGVTMLPQVISANRKYPNSFNSKYVGNKTPLTVDGLSFLDGGVTPQNQLVVSAAAGPESLSGSLRYGIVKDLEVGTYLDYVLNDVDESEQGLFAKLRFLNQDEGAPFTAGLSTTVGLTNEPFLNFFNNNRQTFAQSGLNKSVPIVFSDDNGPRGELFIVTFSAPFHYRAGKRANFWFTPTVGVVQRQGVELGGFNLGGSYEVVRDLSVLAEVGANFLGNGNTFVGNRLADRIPWNFALRWNPRSLFDKQSKSLSSNRNYVEVYVTNRVGASPWHQLRVLDQNDITFGGGVTFSLF